MTPPEVWTNWAGNQRAEDVDLRRPRGVEAIVALVEECRARGRRAKVVGSGHSFNDIAMTDGAIIDLRRHCRALEVQPGAGTATVEAGMTLAGLNAVLAGAGMALPTMGDSDAQTVAGALATGTHGTGRAAASLATPVRALELVTADGDVHTCSKDRNRELYEAARVGLGALGIVTAVTLDVVPAFNLHAVEAIEDLGAVLTDVDRRVAVNDHFELFWFPHTTAVRTKQHNRTDAPPSGNARARRFVDRVLVENVAFGALCRVERRWPALTPKLAPLAAAGGRRELVDRCHRVFATPRRVHFLEMEYALPRSALAAALTRLPEVVREEGLQVAFPVEVRFAPADDIWLSTANGRDTAYVAVHQYVGMDHARWFAAVESVMVEAGGRPHWGKLHTRSAADLAGHYPMWSRWQDQRARADPEGMWSNGYLHRVVGPPAG